MEEDKKEEIKIVKVTEELIKAKTYEVRGYKVMLDFDLAKIYGYSTKAFNQQVKNNSERFASDFAFKLTKEEVNNLRSKNLTSSWGGSRYLPNAFTFFFEVYFLFFIPLVSFTFLGTVAGTISKSLLLRLVLSLSLLSSKEI